MPLGQFLFEYLYRRGVRHSFGIPGDFALPTFTWLEKSKIRNVTMTHEPAAGFAADAYSRINGIGLVCVTYCVGGLNVLNAIAGAYAEKSPVVVVSGAPGRKDREKDPLLHHKVKTFETQRRIYDEVTVASTVLLDEQRAASEIVRCVEACLRHKRPVYLEIPHDIVDRDIPITGLPLATPGRSDPHTLQAALQETLSLVRTAKKPVILAANKSVIEGRGDQVVAFLRGWLAGVREYNDNREKATQIVLSYFTKKGFTVNDKVMKLMLSKIDVNPNYVPALKAYLEAESATLVKQNKLSSAPDWNKLLNRELLAAAGTKA